MDVSSWPIDRIMALPDWCFGRRWWIGEYVGTAAGALTYFTIKDRLPDWFVVWQMFLDGTDREAGTGIDLTIRLADGGGDNDSFWKANRLFQQIASENMTYEWFLNVNGHFYLRNLRTAHESKNNRICGAFKIRNETATCENQIALLISSVPREVPDWVVSGLAGVR